MSSIRKLVYLIVIAVLLFESGVFAGTSGAEEKSNNGGIGKLLKDIGNVLASFAGPQKEVAGVEIKDPLKAELAEAKAKMMSELARIEKDVKVQAKARAEEKVEIEKEYKSALAKAESQYREAKNKLKKRRKDEGVDGLGALFPDKKKAAVLKSINEEEKRIEADYKEAKLDLEAKMKSLAKKRAEKKAQIEAGYQEALAKINLKSQYAKAKIQYAHLAPSRGYQPKVPRYGNQNKR